MMFTGIHKSIHASLLAWLLLLSAAVPAAEIYKWTDEAGRVHYGDKPQADNAESVTIHTPSSSDDPAMQERRQKRQRLLEVLEEDRRRSEEQREAAHRERKKRELRCAQARKRLEKTLNASFLYEQTDDPRNPRVLSREERQAKTARLRKQVDTWCG